jgi:hypothetical protein
MLPLFIGSIQEYLKSDQPHMQHSGLTCMSVLTENCHESYKGELKNIFGLMLPILNTSNPRLIVDIVVANIAFNAMFWAIMWKVGYFI